MYVKRTFIININKGSPFTIRSARNVFVFSLLLPLFRSGIATKEITKYRPLPKPRNKRFPFLCSCNCEWFPALFVFRPHEPRRNTGRPFNALSGQGLAPCRKLGVHIVKKRSRTGTCLYIARKLCFLRYNEHSVS